MSMFSTSNKSAPVAAVVIINTELIAVAVIMSLPLLTYKMFLNAAYCYSFLFMEPGHVRVRPRVTSCNSF